MSAAVWGQPGLCEHPGHDICRRMSEVGARVTFRLGIPDADLCASNNALSREFVAFIFEVWWHLL